MSKLMKLVNLVKILHLVKLVLNPVIVLARELTSELRGAPI